MKSSFISSFSFLQVMQLLTWELMPCVETLCSFHGCHPSGHTDHTWLKVCRWKKRSVSNVLVGFNVSDWKMRLYPSVRDCTFELLIFKTQSSCMCVMFTNFAIYSLFLQYFCQCAGMFSVIKPVFTEENMMDIKMHQKQWKVKMGNIFTWTSNYVSLSK